MALQLADRVQQTGTANTTVSFNLSGSVSGYQSFSSAITTGNTTYYAASDGTNWEVGIGTLTSSILLTRTTILASSNSGSAVSTFGSSINIFVTQPAENTVVSSNNPGTSGYVLTSQGTGVAPIWAAGGVGTITTTDFTATSGQTVFTVTYIVGLVSVYRNGIKLGAADYTATNGTSITLATGAITGDLVEVQAFSSLNLTTAVSSFSAGTTGLTPSSATAGAVTLAGTLAVANGGTGVTTSTGSGNNVLSTSPTLVTPVLGTPTSATLTNATGLPLSTGVTGTLPIANGGTGVTTSTGSGNNVLSTSPTLVTPALGTPSAAVLTNATGLPVGGISATGTPSSTTYLRGDSTWSTIVAGASISNDTSTATAEYPLFAAATSGTPTTIYTSNANYTYVPSTGTLSATVVNASNGFYLNPQTNTASYTIPSGSNAMTAGKFTVATSTTITISTGSRWVIV
jgi:hypothetical protein